MIRLMILFCIAISCAGCPSRWQSLQQVEQAAPVLQSLYLQHPGALILKIDVVPSIKRPERYRIQFHDPALKQDFTIIVDSAGRLEELRPFQQ